MRLCGEGFKDKGIKMGAIHLEMSGDICTLEK